jgi:hypothetical protein
MEIKAEGIGDPQADNQGWGPFPLLDLSDHRSIYPGKSAQPLQGKTLAGSFLFQSIHNAGQYPICLSIIHQEQNGA